MLPLLIRCCISIYGLLSGPVNRIVSFVALEKCCTIMCTYKTVQNSAVVPLQNVMGMRKCGVGRDGWLVGANKWDWKEAR